MHMSAGGITVLATTQTGPLQLRRGNITGDIKNTRVRLIQRDLRMMQRTKELIESTGNLLTGMDLREDITGILLVGFCLASMVNWLRVLRIGK